MRVQSGRQAVGKETPDPSTSFHFLLRDLCVLFCFRFCFSVASQVARGPLTINLRGARVTRYDTAMLSDEEAVQTFVLPFARLY